MYEPLDILGVNRENAMVIVNNPMTVADMVSLHGTGNMNNLALDYYYYSNLLKKHPGNADITSATLDDFYAAESRAGEFNAKFEALTLHPQLGRVLRIWRDQVSIILKKKIDRPATITSGATTTCQKGNTPMERFKHPEITYELYTYIQKNELMDRLPNLKVSLGIGIGEVVPKTRKIGRFMIKPCAINALEQRREGNALRARLLEEGVDLSTAPDLHKRLAWFSSIRNHLTTDDQKWASPLIYTNLVRFLVADKMWLDPLIASRDRVVLMPNGSEHVLEQFAGTGNGYCFELETIIFFGLLRTAAFIHGMSIRHKDIKVFGDDLIYPKELTATVRKIGSAVGFITNVEKSYSDGPFRESCGGDYLDGVNIRPVYLKQDFDSAHGCTVMANLIYELYLRHNVVLPRCYGVWKRLIRRAYVIHDKRIPRGPRHMDCLHGQLPGSWCFSKDRSGEPMLPVWTERPQKLQKFSTIAYKCDPSYILAMVSGGYMKGYGLVKPDNELLITTRKGRSFELQGPPRPSAYPSIIPVPGTAYRFEVSRARYLHPPLFEQTRPLDVFFVLPQTNCNPRLYSKNYVRELEGAITVLRCNLLSKLTQRLQMQTERLNAMVSEINFDLDL